MHQNYVQLAYDKAVDPNGDPTERVTKYLVERFGLATEMLFMVDQMAAHLAHDHRDDPDGGVDAARNALLAMFSTGVIFQQDHGDLNSVYIAETN